VDIDVVWSVIGIKQMHNMKQLETNQVYFQRSIEEILKRYKAQPAAGGYIDLILTRFNAVKAIQALAELPVAVVDLSWWCHVTPENKGKYGCPHGYGGPINRFGIGRFSECDHYPIFSVENHGVNIEKEMIDETRFALKCSELTCDYLENQLPKEDFFSECLWFGLWLCVPDDWERLSYLTV
jgi:hypothetical protein